jgi:integrase
MSTSPRGRKRARGSIEELPSGALRVSVYAGIDPLTKRRHYLRETIPAGAPRAAQEADKTVRRLQHQVDDRRQPRTSATLGQLLDKYLDLADIEATTGRTYRGYVEHHIRPLVGHVKVGAFDADLMDSFYAELRRCRAHCDRRPFVEHRTNVRHECDHRCGPHTCRALGASTIRQIHFILSGAFRQAVRWRWVALSPMGQANPPAAPRPNPQPPTTAEAAKILAAAFCDPDWGTFVWVAMTTGARRGELCALRWSKVDLDNGVIGIATSIAQTGSKTWEKDTKSHQQRRIAIDAETVALLREHLQRCQDRARQLDMAIEPDAFVFSLSPDSSTHLIPDSVSQRYGHAADRLGIETHLHSLRHYSATELISAGVDVRTVAGRLGHGGGGTTTLRVYTAWVSESDQRASQALTSRVPARPTADQLIQARPKAPYERVAASLRAAIEDGALPPGQPLPSTRTLAEQYGISEGTARRAVQLLTNWGLIGADSDHSRPVVAHSAFMVERP